MTDTNGHIEGFEKLTFEAALTKLDETVLALEAGNLSLDESIALYEQGMALTRLCSNKLAQAKLKITEIHTAHAEQNGDAGDEDTPAWLDEPSTL